MASNLNEKLSNFYNDGKDAQEVVDPVTKKAIEDNKDNPNTEKEFTGNMISFMRKFNKAQADFANKQLKQGEENEIETSPKKALDKADFDKDTDKQLKKLKLEKLTLDENRFEIIEE